MNYNIKVSVIVPVYNAEKHIAETALYIKNQTLKEIEIIYVDDGSTDRTPELLEQIKNDDDRVLVLRQKNKYAGVARNTGFRHARGEYVAFWDGDDIFREDALEKMYLKSVADHADICICGARHYDDETGETQNATTFLKTKQLPEQIPFGHEQIDRFLFNFSTNVPWNKLYRREFLIENRIEFQDIKRANDNYFAMKAYFYARVFTVIDEPLIDYRINYQSSLTEGASDMPYCVYEAYKKTYEELRQKEEFINVRQSFFNKTLRGFLYFLNKQRDVGAYTKLYDIFKEKVIQAWDFPKEENYYYSVRDYDRLKRIRTMEAEQFLLTECSDFRKRMVAVQDKKRKQAEKLKEKIALKNERIKSLREKNTRLNRKMLDLQNSTTYKMGKMITYVPRKIKDIAGGRKR